MAKARPLLERLLNTPDLATIVPRLEPEVLHRVVETCGLADCAALVALATPGQLARVLDLDLWRVRAPGADEELDADRFGAWIEVLMQAGAAVAAEKLTALDAELVTAGLTRHAAVFDHAAVSSYTTLDGEQVPGRLMNGEPVAEIGGYVIEARRTSAWEPIVELLAFLQAERVEDFHRLMRGCVRLSNGTREADGSYDLLDEAGQHMFDVASDREARRERHGYVTPAQAHGFLRGARALHLAGDRPARSASAAAYFRALQSTPATDREAAREPSAESMRDASSAVESGGGAGIVEVLREAGVLAPPARALLGAAGGAASRLAYVEAYVGSHPNGPEELAYLANTMIAGCSIQGRPFTAREARDGAAAIGNLGLQNWPARWSDPDLVAAFQVGWTILHRDVVTYAARCLVDILAAIQCRDRDIQLRLDGLRRGLISRLRDGEPWRARGALDVILMLDAPAWAALLALLDECPVVHAALGASRRACRTIDPMEFEFISESSQIATVHTFMAALPSMLTT